MRLLLPLLFACCVAAADLVTHAGTGADERFQAVHRRSDGTLLSGGQAADLRRLTIGSGLATLLAALSALAAAAVRPSRRSSSAR